MTDGEPSQFRKLLVTRREKDVHPWDIVTHGLCSGDEGAGHFDVIRQAESEMCHVLLRFG